MGQPRVWAGVVFLAVFLRPCRMAEKTNTLGRSCSSCETADSSSFPTKREGLVKLTTKV